MILQTWKPNYEKGKIIYYTIVDNTDLKNLKGKTAYKVIWVCDNKNCKYTNKKHIISACHLTKSKMCYDLQICRPCQCSGDGNGRFNDHRTWDEIYGQDKSFDMKKHMSKKWIGDLNPSKKDYVKIKKNQPIIDKDFIKKIVNEKNFILIDVDILNGKYSRFIIRCDKGHEIQKKYLNFVRKDKKFICEKCFYDSISMNLTDEEIKEIEKYKKQIRSLTAKNYRLYKDIINPNNLKISKNDHHIDHKFSIYEGFKNNVDTKIISAKENLQVIPSKENLSKQGKCSISLDQLLSLTNYL